MVPKRGTQEERRRLRDKLRQENPKLTAETEAQPWYVDPDGELGSDDYAVWNIEWNTDADHRTLGTHRHLKTEYLPHFIERSIGPVEQGDGDQRWEYSYHIRASFALQVLKIDGHVPADATLAPVNLARLPGR